MFGAWQAGNHTGAELVNEPVSLTWNSLMTRDLDGATSFLEAIFPGMTARSQDFGGEAYTILTLGENGVFVVLEDTLTRGEQTLNDAGDGEAVLDLRRRWQRVMEKDLSREIEVLTGRTVVGFMSDNHIDPDLAVEVFVLAPRTGAS